MRVLIRVPTPFSLNSAKGKRCCKIRVPTPFYLNSAKGKRCWNLIFEELKNNMGHSDMEITKRLFTETKRKFYSETKFSKEETLSDDWGIEIIN